MINLDLDNITTNKLISKARLLKSMFPQATVEYRRSCGGRGGHIIVLGEDVSDNDISMIRRMMGDDIKRMNKDTIRSGNRPTKTLFTRKLKDGKYTYASKWETVEL